MSDKPQTYDIEISISSPDSGGYVIAEVVAHKFNTYGPENCEYHKIEATTAGGLEHTIYVRADRFISMSTDPGDDPQDVVRIGYVDSESLTVTIGERSEIFTHDEHGHSGMEAAERTARMFAAHLGIEVVGE